MQSVFGQYIHADSIIHRIDPRIKILCSITFSVLILKSNIIMLFIINSILFSLLYAAQMHIKYLYRALRPMFFFIFFIFFIHLLFTKGTPIPPFQKYPVTLTYEGLFLGLLTSWQFLLLLWAASILTMATSPSELVIGIERLLRPLTIIGIPSHDIATMISIALRFVPTIFGEFHRIRDAQICRAIDFKTGSLLQRLKKIRSLVIPLILGSFRRADELAIAMESRAYRRGQRTYLKELQFKKCDYISLFLLVALLFLFFLH